MTPSSETAIDRVDAMTRTARTSWFGLISYLAFVGVTLIGVRDEDFFLVEKETPLPLIGVSIPTFLFFYVAPILGAALFAYFHLHLLKLWEALSDALEVCDADAPLSERVAPWLVVDFALSYREGALRRLPAQWLSWLVTLALVFFATPIVLGAFWWRSMPAHDPWLTLGACGLSLAVTLYLGLVSWARMRGLIAKRRRMVDWRGGLATAAGVLTLAVVSLVGWFRVGEPLSHYYIAQVLERRDAEEIAAADELALVRLRQRHEAEIEDTLWTFPLLSLARADLAGVDFSYAPDDWLGFDGEKERVRAAHCEEAGFPRPLCTQLDTPAEELTTVQTLRRLDFCKSALGETARRALCHHWFAVTARAFEAGWPAHWRNSLAAFNQRDLSGKDFRDADLSGARMQGVDLRDARMQRANLRSANVQGADFSRAEMQAAIFNGAEMQGAKLSEAQMQSTELIRSNLREAILNKAVMTRSDLRWAEMQHADLRETDLRSAELVAAKMQNTKLRKAKMRGINLAGAEMQGAVLVQAEMQGAILDGARMQGTDLRGAMMQGSSLTYVELDASTNLRSASLRGSSIRDVDGATLERLRLHYSDIFADGSVSVPKGTRPEHWADQPLSDVSLSDTGDLKLSGPFTDAWRAWQLSIGMDPENPE